MISITRLRSYLFPLLFNNASVPSLLTSDYWFLSASFIFSFLISLSLPLVGDLSTYDSAISAVTGCLTIRCITDYLPTNYEFAIRDKPFLLFASLIPLQSRIVISLISAFSTLLVYCVVLLRLRSFHSNGLRLTSFFVVLAILPITTQSFLLRQVFALSILTFFSYLSRFFRPIYILIFCLVPFFFHKLASFTYLVSSIPFLNLVFLHLLQSISFLELASQEYTDVSFNSLILLFLLLFISFKYRTNLWSNTALCNVCIFCLAAHFLGFQFLFLRSLIALQILLASESSTLVMYFQKLLVLPNYILLSLFVILAYARFVYSLPY